MPWAMAAVLFAGCIVPAPVDPVEAPVQPLLVIQASDLKPPSLESLIISRAQVSGQEFSVKQAIRAVGTRTPLKYYWYYDLAEGSIPGARIVCGNEPSCQLGVCALANAVQDSHTVHLYVADQALPFGAKKATDFPAGTLWAGVQWPVKLKDSCPP